MPRPIENNRFAPSVLGRLRIDSEVKRASPERAYYERIDSTSGIK